MTLPKGIVGTIVKLLAASLAIGFVMRWLGITPQSLFAHFGETFGRALDKLTDFAGWAVDYVVVGAIVVVPIWLVVFLLGRFRGR